MSSKPESNSSKSNTSGAAAAKLVVLSAPSGAGKSTLASMLLAKRPSFKLSISYTTRAPRGAEKNGVEYFFVSDAEFVGMIDAGQFLEHAVVFGKNRYGTARKTVEAMMDGGYHVLFDIDVQGARSLKKAFGPRCVTIFIHPPSFEELESRLRNRKTDTPEAIEARLKTAREEIAASPEFDHQIVNRDLDTAYSEIEDVLRRERCL